METKVCSKCNVEKNKDEFSKDNRPNSKSKILSQCKECKSKHSREYRKTHKDTRDRKEYKKKYYKKNVDKFKEWNKLWAKNNRKHRRQYLKNWRNENPSARIAHSLRTRINQAIRGSRKSDKTINLLSCSIPELIKHLEQQFTKGMSWDNYGEWHIDHIVPCASFDLTKEEEQRKCFHYSNLQPLWAADNLRKGDRVIL